MGNALIDAWTLVSVFEQIDDSIVNKKDNNDILKLCMGYLTTGIVLWDNLGYITNRIDDMGINRAWPNNDLGEKFHKLFDIILTDINRRDELLDNFGTTNEMEIAKLYMNICHSQELDYLPHPIRAEYLN